MAAINTDMWWRVTKDKGKKQRHHKILRDEVKRQLLHYLARDNSQQTTVSIKMMKCNAKSAFLVEPTCPLNINCD